MAKTFKQYLKEISDQQMKDMSAGNAYNGGKSIPKQKKKAKAEDPKSQERKDAAVAKMDAEDKAARKAQADKFAAMKNEDLENNVLTTVENENGERHVVEVPIDHFKVNEGDDRIIFKGKEIDPDTIEYDMQDFSDMIAPIEYAKYTDGTEVDDEDLEALDELPAMQDWISTDYMDRRADQADMYRDAQKHGDFESTELDRIKELAGASIDETYDDDDAFYEAYGELWWNEDDIIDEAEYQGRKVKLGKPMQGDVKKFKVYVKDPKTGNVKKVNFGHGGSSVKGKAMSIKKNNPKRRKSFRARHNCDNPGPRTKARYWSCRKW
jgi:hypothetical protein|tara:strand:+ start:635 stop:1603 length:969 start_codon:yes stop_codon:yes gene_type:complete